MDHVEECPSYYVDCLGTICDCDYEHICMCRELRACEQRMLDDDVLSAAYHGQKGYDVGYAAALDAAREAYDPTGGDGFIRGEWRQVESALLSGLITDEEYERIAMTHDPLCYRSHDQTLGRDPFCQCAVVAKAREDERSNNFTPDDFSDGMVEAYQRGLDAAWEAVSALATERELRSPSGLDIDIHAALAAIDALKEDK